MKEKVDHYRYQCDGRDCGAVKVTIGLPIGWRYGENETHYCNRCKPGKLYRSPAFNTEISSLRALYTEALRTAEYFTEDRSPPREVQCALVDAVLAHGPYARAACRRGPELRPRSAKQGE